MPWEGFGDGFLLLPSWTYQVDQRAWLSFAACETESPAAEQVLGVFDTIWDSLERPIGVIPPPVSVRRIDEADHETWTRQVDEIRRHIKDGAVEKIVAARHCVVELETGAGSLDVLKRLEGRFPGCTRFALWRGDAAFLGATPELLISRRGLSVLSEALAGSTAHGDAARMMASSKEREEHQLVVQAILSALEPFCDSLRSANSVASSIAIDCSECILSKSISVSIPSSIRVFLNRLMGQFCFHSSTSCLLRSLQGSPKK